jgi:hypothetical protein
MKTLRLIVISILAIVSVGVAAWTIAVGLNAPAKIANNTPLVQNVKSTKEGIEKLGEIFESQIGDDMLDKDGIKAEQEKLNKTINEHIPAYEAKVAAKEDAKAKAEADLAMLGELKSLNAKQKKQLKEAEAVVADYKATVDTLNIYKSNVDIMKGNIENSIKANDEAKVNAENVIALSNAVSSTMFWAYALVGILVFLIFVSWILGMIQNPKSLVKTLLFGLIAAAVVGVAYFVASTHGWADGETLKDAAGYDLGIGTDPATRKVFGTFEYMISDTSIIIAYIVGGGALVAALFSVIRGYFKS